MKKQLTLSEWISIAVAVMMVVVLVRLFTFAIKVNVNYQPIIAKANEAVNTCKTELPCGFKIITNGRVFKWVDSSGFETPFSKDTYEEAVKAAWRWWEFEFEDKGPYFEIKK